MSTDTYIDFHSPEGWERWPNWEIWSGFLRDQENSRKDSPNFRGHYDPCRISYSHNVTMDCNFDLWDEIRNFRGLLLAPGSYSLLSEKWREIYLRAQNPPDSSREDNRFCRDDMITPEEFDELLEEHIGYYIQFRID